MRIQHNIMAMNAYRNYSNNTSALAKNLEKLSSGYKINRAGDDAAGLAISEKMRAQITGLKTAQKNAKDGISLIQTAEGSLTEVHDMLNRMVELADQSANGTYDNEVDRANLQKEFEALRTEIDRIADASNFNGIKLLNGNLSGSSVSYTDGTLTGFPAVGNTPNTNTIVHADGNAEVAPSFTVDLSSIEFTTDAVTDRLKITIGGTEFTIGKGGADAAFDNAKTTVKASDFLAGLVTQINTNDSGEDAGGSKNYGGIKIGDLVYKATADGTTGLKFTLSDVIEDDGTSAATNKQVVPSGNKDLVPEGLVSVDGSAGVLVGTLNTGNLTINPGKAAQTAKLANTKFTLTADQVKDGNKLTIGDTTYVFKVGADSKTTAGDGEKLVDLSDIEDDNTNKLSLAGARLTVAAADNAMYSVGSSAAGTITLQEKATYTGDADLSTLDGIKATVKLSVKGAATADRSLTLQIGDTSENFNKLSVSVQDMHAAALGIGGISIATQAGAQTAIDAIKTAINDVSSTRGGLGALQNRLEHTMNNLSVMQENIQDAEASIRDVDVAEEMMDYTKNNILVQSAQAMLAQANQVPQGVLQLLQ